MYRDLTVSVVIPCFNEEHGIKQVLASIPTYVDEVIVVDNNSTDNTARVARDCGAQVVFEGRKGYGRAHQAGLSAAGGDVIATLDGDGQSPACSIGPMIDFMLDRGLDFVSGTRFPLRNRDTMALTNRLGNRLLNYAFRLLYFHWIADSQSGMWVFRRTCLRYLHPTHPGMAFSEEIKVEALQEPEVRFGEFHIDYHERIGESKLFVWRDGWSNLTFLVRRRFGRITEHISEQVNSVKLD